MTTALLDDVLFGADVDYDGSDTIVVAGLTTNNLCGQVLEIPGPIVSPTDPSKAQSWPIRIRWDLRLVSANLRVTNTPANPERIDVGFVALGTRDLQVFEDNRWIDVSEFFARIVRGSKTDRPLEDIIKSLAERGMDFHASNMFYFQQLGASIDAFRDVVQPLFLETFRATDNTRNARKSATGKSRTLRGLRLPNNGLNIVSFETSTVDRTMGVRNQGWIGPLDASMTTVRAIIDADRRLKGFRKVLADDHASDAEKILADQGRAALMRYWTSGSGYDTRPFRTWGGTSIEMTPDGTVPRYHTVSAPCGRMVVEGPDGNLYPISVWLQAGETNKFDPDEWGVTDMPEASAEAIPVVAADTSPDADDGAF